MHLDHQSIKDLAYRLWEARGRPEGSAEQDWREAERQLSAREAPPAPASTSASPSVQAPASAPKGASGGGQRARLTTRVPGRTKDSGDPTESSRPKP